MGFFKKSNKEDILIPFLFGEIDDSELYKLFPNIDFASDEKKEKNIEQLLSKTNQNEESRVQIIAWNKLRKYSVLPEKSIEKNVLGFVMEVGMRKGTDYLAVYSDNYACYYNYAGGKIYYMAKNEQVDSEIKKLLSCCATIVNNIDIWGGVRPSPPKNGYARVNFLTPKGLMFGEAPLVLLECDPIANGVVSIATNIMQLLIKLDKS